MLFIRELVIPALLFLMPVPAGFGQAVTTTQLTCGGVAKQSGLLVCDGPAQARIRIETPETDGIRVAKTDAFGRVYIGLKQDEPSELTLIPLDGDTPALTVEIAPRQDDFRTIRGLDCDKIDARTETQKQHAADSWVKKQAAFARFHAGPGASEGFRKPANGPASSPFGPTRKYIGVGADGAPCESISVHRGYDMAVSTGTPVVAPASGTVLLADADLYYEGGSVFLDHGGGLVSIFMHMSAVDVEAGDIVGAGDRLGASGNTGRSTGPHLHWAVKWRNMASDDRNSDFYIDPALLLDLQPAAAAPSP